MTTLVAKLTTTSGRTGAHGSSAAGGVPPRPGQGAGDPTGQPEAERPAAGRNALKARSDALAERMKELKCLHSISRMLKGRRADLGGILQEVVDVLPSACVFPDLACASVALKSRRYESRGFREPKQRRQAEIVVDGRHVGVLELGYAGGAADGREPEFLPEEQALLTTVAERLAELVALTEAQNQLSTYQDHLRSLAAELAMAEERERRSLAINLHDRIGQGLAVAKLKLETLRHLLPPDYHSRLDDVSALIKEIVNDTRSLTFDISPPILYELGLEPAVAWLGEHITRQFGLRVDVQCAQDLVELSEGVRVVLFRSIQEVLMNTVKHAGASRATIRLARRGASEVCATVEDDGTGFDVAAHSSHPSAATGFGLFSIRERISHLGGTMHVESGAGIGTRIRLTVPGVEAGRSRVAS